MAPSLLARATAALLATSSLASAQKFSIDSEDNIKKTAKALAADLVSYYDGNEPGKTPGILPGPPPDGDYYWWEAGAMFGTLIDYWSLTGDDTYNDITKQALSFQGGEADDYQPENFTASLGNDDQGFWGMSAMLAAESNFTNPPDDKPSWLALAQAVFNTQAAPERHDDKCGGGMRWQIPLSNNGYNYKNSIANGCFFNIGARLGRYTGNKTYIDWAEKTWDWMVGVGYITDEYDIYDGAHVEDNCTKINKAQFSYNNAVFLQGAAFMYNLTDGEEKWKKRVDGLVDNTLKVFFSRGAAYEVACEGRMTCTTDMLSFKGYLHRWMATTTQIAPFTAEKILPVLKKSAEKAVAQCTGGDNGRTCGFQWVKGEFDGKTGVGETMNVLGAVSSLLIGSSKGPLTNETGATSKGDPNAGSKSHDVNKEFDDLTTADKAGAGILTLLLIVGALSTFGWMSYDGFEGSS